MRTLKKVLALSLVFAMAFTLMAGAAYKDEDSIDSSLRDDITLLEALGVFQGDENGNFNPTNNVTRAEAAKMIYVLKNNGVDDGAVAFQGVATFSDVPVGHWAEGYVNYCANLGIMAGWTENGQKVFNPSGNVTGVELTKMLLCLVGYKADIQGYTNSNSWQTNVLLDGASAGITNNYTPSVYSAAPRQWTARLLVNAINAPFVTYNRGEIMYGTMNNPTLSYARQYLKLHIAEGTLTATNTVAIRDAFSDTLRGTNKDDITVSVLKIDSEYIRNDEKAEGRTYDIAVNNGLMGQKVRVYYRSADYTSLEVSEVYAVLADPTQKVVNTTVDQISFSSSNADRMTVEGEGTMTYSDYSADETKLGAHTINLYVDNALYVKNGTPDMPKDDGASTPKAVPNLKDYLGINSSDAVKLIYDEDGYVTEAYVSKTPVYAIVDEIDSANGIFRLIDENNTVVSLYEDDGTTKITFNRSNSDNFADYLNIDSSVAAEDVVKITRNVSTGELKYDVTVLDAVNSKAQSYTTKEGKYDTITVDGTAYELNKYPMGGYTWDVTAGAGGHDNFYVDGSYVVYSTGESSSASVSNLAYIYDTATTSNGFAENYKVKVIMADGTKGAYTLNQKSGIGEAVKNGSANLTDYEGKIVKYSLRDNTLTLTAIKDSDIQTNLTDNRATYLKGGKISVNESEGTAQVNNVEYVMNDSTYFFVKDTSEKDADDQYAVVKGSELKADVSSNVETPLFVGQKVNGFNTILAGYIEASKVVTREAEDYYFVTGNPSYVGENADGDYVIELPVNAAGNDTKLEFKYGSDASINDEMSTLNAMVGKLVNADLSSDGSMESAADLTIVSPLVEMKNYTDTTSNDSWLLGSLTAWDGSRATIGDTTFKVAEDVKVYNVNVNDKKDDADFEGEGSAVKASLKNEDKPTDGYNANAVFVRNTDGEISVIFTEIDGADIGFIVNKMAGEPSESAAE